MGILNQNFNFFQTKSEIFPIGKNDVTNFPNTNNLIPTDHHLTKFWDILENLGHSLKHSNCKTSQIGLDTYYSKAQYVQD